ncbi:MAG: RlmE family RNA methyltransferase [Betaproteobacteria bacterium]|nr:MAG: RlmE family RNA methyltransferase [Betaproteobacteria bacterium]
MRTKSSQRWLQRHVADPFVRRARAAGYRSRAAFKLLEIDARERLLRPGARVVDLGAAPGGWSQIAAARVAPGGLVVAVDLLEIAPISGVIVLRGDFCDSGVQAAIASALGGQQADLVLSDLSPNLSGIASADQARAADLLRAAIEFCRRHLKPGGTLLAKVFQGGEFGAVLAALKAAFREVRTRKPAASRGESRETYLLARGLRGL